MLFLVYQMVFFHSTYKYFGHALNVSEFIHPNMRPPISTSCLVEILSREWAWSCCIQRMRRTVLTRYRETLPTLNSLLILYQQHCVSFFVSSDEE